VTGSQAGATALILCGLTACALSRQLAQLEVRHDPFILLDKQSSQYAGEVLVVPRYSSFQGVASGGGHGPGAGRDRVYLAAPFLYRSGEPFIPEQPNSAGFVAAGAFLGKGVSLDGVLIVAPGYRPIWLWSLWDKGSSRSITLVPLSREDGARQLHEVSALLHKEFLRGDERELWSLGGDATIEVRLAPDEIATVDAFLARSMLLIQPTGKS